MWPMPTPYRTFQAWLSFAHAIHITVYALEKWHCYPAADSHFPIWDCSPNCLCAIWSQSTYCVTLGVRGGVQRWTWASAQWLKGPYRWQRSYKCSLTECISFHFWPTSSPMKPMPLTTAKPLATGWSLIWMTGLYPACSFADALHLIATSMVHAHDVHAHKQLAVPLTGYTNQTKALRKHARICLICWLTWACPCVPRLQSSAWPVIQRRQLSTDKIVTLSLAGQAVMTFSCNKKNHKVAVELPPRTLQVWHLHNMWLVRTHVFWQVKPQLYSWSEKSRKIGGMTPDSIITGASEAVWGSHHDVRYLTSDRVSNQVHMYIIGICAWSCCRV